MLLDLFLFGLQELMNSFAYLMDLDMETAMFGVVSPSTS
jgi:hypothetical protein